MLKLYLDDIGTHEGSLVVGVGGLIGNEAQWTAFDTQWKAVLTDPLPDKRALQKWSSYDCRWGQGEFENYNDAERDQVTFRFREIITRSGLTFASNMVDGAAWNEVIAALGGTAIFRLITRLQGWASIHPDGPNIAAYYDLGRMKNLEIQTLSGLLNDPATALSHIAGLSFLRVCETTPLQGADMVATEGFCYAQNFLRNGSNAFPRPHLEAFLRDNLTKGTGEMLDREAITKRRMSKFIGSDSWEWSVPRI
jgi:hypothetical protein